MVNEGTGFAKRSTWWDAFFLMLSGRGDEGVAGFFLRLLMNFVFNFTIGMVRSLSCLPAPPPAISAHPSLEILTPKCAKRG